MQSKLLPLLQRDAQSSPQQALAEQVVFQSPVKDYRGRADVTHIVSMIGSVLEQIDAERELTADREIVTIITASYRGHEMTGVLEETHDQRGRVERAALLLRPLSALREAITGMQTALEQSPLPSKL